MKIDYLKLGILVKQKRGDLSLRETEAETGISIATLSRVERGGATDMSLNTFIKLCEWLNISVDSLLTDSKQCLPSSEIVFNGVSIRIEVRPV